jgi:hypothetical protein
MMLKSVYQSVFARTCFVASIVSLSSNPASSQEKYVESPGTEGNGNFVIGPDYAIAPELKDQGNPKGKFFKFSMRLADSKVFRGDDSTLDPKKDVRAEREISVYVPAAYQDGTKAPILVMHDGPSNLNLVRNALDNLTISKDPARKLPAFIAIGVQNGGNDGKGSQRGLEYDTMSDRLARFINDEVLPAVLNNAEIKAAFPKTSFLRGNHEDMLMGFLGLGGQGGEFNLSNGGAEFFKSYGIEPLGPVSRLRENLPTEHLDFFKSLELGVSLGEFLFVHAGINPNLGIDEQRVRDLMWVRAEFVRNPHNLGKTVVFGHTPFADVMIHLPYKIGIDTGLVYGNKLSCLEVFSGQVFQIDRNDTVVTEKTLELGSSARA